MLTLSAHLVVLLFALATLFYLGCFISNKKVLWRYAQFLLLVGVLIQGLGFVAHIWSSGFPLLQKNEEAFLFSAWVLALLFLIMQMKYRVSALALLLMPSVLVLYSLAHFSSPESSGRNFVLTSPWASMHIVSSFLAFSLFTLSFLVALLFLLQEYQLKAKRISLWLERLPSLDLLDQLHVKALRLGFVFLSIGIWAGAAWAKFAKGVYITGDAKQLFTLAAWLVYLIFLTVRVRSPWRGKRGLLLSLLGFVLLLFTFLEVGHS